VRKMMAECFNGKDQSPHFLFEEAGYAGAVMRPGSGGGCEDAVFVDLKRGVFAVADGAGRSSGASRRLMSRFGEIVSDFEGVNLSFFHRSGDAVLEHFKGAVEQMLADIPYGDAGTLTALKLLRCGGGTTALLCHCGDSLLFCLDPHSGLRQVSQTNFWLAGRSKKVYQAEAFPVSPGAVFLLATDGISNLCFPGPYGMTACLTETIGATPVEKIPGELLARYDNSRQPVDDVALVSVSSESVSGSGLQVFVDIHGVRRQRPDPIPDP